jgi:hypothetical protein
MARSNQGLNKSTYHLREVNRSTVLYNFCMEEVEKTVNHDVLDSTLEDVRVKLGIPEGADMTMLADLVKKRKTSKDIITDFKSMIFYDQQACQVIQIKSLEYMKSYRGVAGLHESSVRRIETTDRARTRWATAEAREKKDAKPAGKAPTPSTSGGGATKAANKKPYSRPQQPGGRDFIATYGGPNNCRTCFGPSHLGFACPPLKK